MTLPKARKTNQRSVFALTHISCFLWIECVGQIGAILVWMQNAPLKIPPKDPSASIRPLSFKNYPDNTQPVLSPCNKTSFPWPERHTGLPWLADVFASPEAKYTNFVGMHRGIWMPEFEQADAFATSLNSTKPYHFICVFPRNVHVLSEFMHPVLLGHLL
jgi:hypothetical protein